MKIRDIINNLDKSPANECRVSVDGISNEFGLSFYDLDDTENRFKSYWIARHLCTDSWVGLKAYFFGGELLAVSYQAGRKCDETFEWVGDVAEKAKQYILSLAAKEESQLPLLDLDEDIGDGYRIEFASNLIDDIVELDGVEFRVDKSWKDPDDKYKITHKIKLEDGRVVDIRDCLVPFRLMG